jgi:hypothetical protein
MRKLALLTLAIAAACSSRTTTTKDVSRFHEDGRTKPTVAIASMLDTTSFDASWSVSEELTSGIMSSIAQTGKIFIKASEESPFTENPFGADLSWMKREFDKNEFVVFLELVEHEFVPVKSANLQEASANLNMAVRVRVVDLRGSTPKIVLQEMVKDTYFVPKTLMPSDYSVDTWGTENYQKSPMGVAHGLLISEIANRVSDYILLARSR